MKDGKRLSEEELRALAIKEMDNYIDMGCFKFPDKARPYLIDGFELGYRAAERRDDEPEYCIWKRDKIMGLVPGCFPIVQLDKPAPSFCPYCGKPVKEE